MKKKLLTTLMVAAGLSGMLVNGAVAQQPSAKRILIETEYIQMSQETLSGLMFGDAILKSDTEIRKVVNGLIKSGKATMLDSALVATNSGSRCRIESVEKMVYPTEYEPPSMEAGTADKNGVVVDPVIAGPTPTAFDERPLGLELEVEATLDIEAKKVHLDVDSNVSYFTGNIDWATWKDKFGVANISMAQFYSMKLQTGVTVAKGEYALLAAHSPKGKDGKIDRGNKVLVFVRAVVKEVK